MSDNAAQAISYCQAQSSDKKSFPVAIHNEEVSGLKNLIILPFQATIVLDDDKLDDKQLLHIG